MKTETYLLISIAIMALVTVVLRFLPFLVFKGRNTPKWITYLGKVLPFAIMGMLVVFCLKNVSFVSYPYGIPEILSCIVAAVIHIWKKNTLLSIVCSTACYMVLVQFIFI